jgi:hypothetical protein
MNISQLQPGSEKFDNNNVIVILKKKPSKKQLSLMQQFLTVTVIEKLRIWNLHAVSEVL